MKVTFVLPFASLSGGHRVVATYACKLTSRGHEVWVVSQPWQRPRGVSAVLRRLLGRQAHPPAPIPMLDFLGDRHVVLDTPRPVSAADLPDADAVVATWWETAEWVASMPAEKGRKVYLLQDYEMFRPDTFERVAATYHMPMIKIAVSDYIRDEIRARHGIDDIAVIPNAVDFTQFDAPPRSKNRDLTVGFIYTPTPRKNVRLAIAAVEAARQRLGNLRVISFAGNPPGTNLPIPPWIEFHLNPPQDEIPHLYAACDLWLLTSEKEGFGLPILEAMACRTPVVSTPAGAAASLIDKSNGHIVTPEVEAVTAAIEAFAAMSAAAWAAASQAAWDRSRAWSWEDATEELIALLAAS